MFYGGSQEDDDAYNEINVKQPRVLSYVISNLHAKTQYSVRVRSYNKQGKSRFSNVVVKETLGGCCCCVISVVVLLLILRFYVVGCLLKVVLRFCMFDA